MTDRTGAIYEGRENLNWIKTEMAQVTNRQKETGKLADVIRGQMCSSASPPPAPSPRKWSRP